MEDLNTRGENEQALPVREASDATQPLQLQHLTRWQTQISYIPEPQQPVLFEEQPMPRPEETLATCPICKGMGFFRRNVALEHPQFGKILACQCQEQARQSKQRQQLWELSNMGAFTTKRLETFDPQISGLQEAFQIAAAFANNPVGWLLLVGSSGCGKTHLAAAIANACLEAGFVVLFATVPDLLDHLRATFAPTSHEAYSQLFTRMREAEILVLDDLGAQQSSPWANEKLFQLFNHRYNTGFPTVMTTNPKGLLNTDERIRSRLSERGLVTTLDLTYAGDYRPHTSQQADRWEQQCE